MEPEIIDKLKASFELPRIIEQMQNYWQQEQQMRHTFWNTISDEIKAEFINGDIIYHSPVTKKHSQTGLRLLTLLNNFLLENNRGGFLGYEKVMMRLTRNDYEPDICYWNLSSSQHFTDKQTVFPPADFVVEILSPSTAERDRGVKFQDYALHGISEYWIIDAEQKSVEQYVLEGQIYQLKVKLLDGIISSEAIQNFRLEVEKLFI
jgi:Uma2 family endonuclease